MRKEDDAENAVMQKIREARKRLMAKCHGSDKEFFKFLLRRQRELSKAGKIRVVRFEHAGGK